MKKVRKNQCITGIQHGWLTLPEFSTVQKESKNPSHSCEALILLAMETLLEAVIFDYKIYLVT